MKPSNKLLTKIGFQNEGLLKNYMYQNGKPYDTYIYSFLNVKKRCKGGLVDVNVLEQVELEAKGQSILDLDASELARMIANKEITSREATESYINHIKKSKSHILTF